MFGVSEGDKCHRSNCDRRYFGGLRCREWFAGHVYAVHAADCDSWPYRAGGCGINNQLASIGADAQGPATAIGGTALALLALGVLAHNCVAWPRMRTITAPPLRCWLLQYGSPDGGVGRIPGAAVRQIASPEYPPIGQIFHPKG